MSSEDTLVVANDEKLQTESFVMDQKSVNEKMPLDKSSTEIGQGDVGIPSNDTKSDALDTILTDKVDKIGIDLGDENSDEDLHLKWDDDEDIEEDIISLQLPEEGAHDITSYSTTNDVDMVTTEENEPENQDKVLCMDVTEDADKEIIDITDLSSPIADELEESQSNIDNISDTKQEIKEIDNVTNEENTITIIDDVDDKIKIEECASKSNFIDDDLIIIEDDIDDDNMDSSKNSDVNPAINNKNIVSTETEKDVISNKKDESLENVSVVEGNSDHGLTKPDMMLEIPTQEIIDFIDDSDVSYNMNDSMTDKDTKDKSKEIKEKRKSVDSIIEIEEESTQLKQENVIHDVDDIIETPKKLTQDLCNKTLESDSLKNVEESQFNTELTKSESLIVNENKMQVLVDNTEQASNLLIKKDSENETTLIQKTDTNKDLDMNVSKEAPDSEIISIEEKLCSDTKDTQHSNTANIDSKQVIDNNDHKFKQLRLVSIDKLQTPRTTSPDKEHLKSDKEEQYITKSVVDDIIQQLPPVSSEEKQLPESEIEKTLPTSNFESLIDDNQQQLASKSLDKLNQCCPQESVFKNEKLLPKDDHLSTSDSTNNELQCKAKTSNEEKMSLSPEIRHDEQQFDQITSKNLQKLSTSEIVVDESSSVQVISKHEQTQSASEMIIDEQPFEAGSKNKHITTSEVIFCDEPQQTSIDEQISTILEMLDDGQPTEAFSKVDQISTTSEKTIDESSKMIEEQSSQVISKDEQILTTETTTNEQSVSNTISKDKDALSLLKVTDSNQAITSKNIPEDKQTKSASEASNEHPSTSQDSKDEPLPSTSKTVHDIQPSTSQNTDVNVPTTSEMSEQLAPDSKDEAPEVTDSLGLLAESSRVVEDDEEPDEEEEDDDDFDQDESSNQMTAEHSEDSNAQHSETDASKEQDGKGTDTPQEEKQEFNFDIGQNETKDGKEKDGDMVVDDVVCEEVELMCTEDVDAETSVDKAVTIQDSENVKVTSAETDQAMDIETVKLSDNSDNEANDNKSILRNMLTEMMQKEITVQKVEATKTPPSKKLEITQLSNVLNFVDLEESSSEDDVQEVNKQTAIAGELDATKLIVSSDIQVTSTAAASSDAPASKVTKTTRVNTSEVTIKTVPKGEIVESKLIIPEAKPPEEKSKPKFSLEIFNLDSDEEDSPPAVAKLERKRRNRTILDPTTAEKDTSLQAETTREKNKCINMSCNSDSSVAYFPADIATVTFFDATKKRKAMVCEACAGIFAKRTENLVNGIKDFTPLLNLEVTKESSELVEISDSDSEEETESVDDTKETIGEEGAAMLEDKLASMINEAWLKFKLDARLNEAEDSLKKEMQKLEDESKEIDSLLNECQLATDKLRNELYATFECERHELAPLIVYDTPANKYSCLESVESSSSKRRLSSASESSAKKPAIPLGYTPLDHDTKETPPVQQEKSPAPETTSAPPDNSKVDDDKDIAVLKVSAESAPSDLPPPGEPTKPPLKAGMTVFAMRNMFRSWVRAKIVECQGKNSLPGAQFHNFTVCRVRIDAKGRGMVKQLPARCLAYSEPSNARMTIGTRVIALFNNEDGTKKSFSSGIIAEVPNPVNNYRYLVFFDDGYAQYVRHADTRLVCECSPLVWEEVHPLSREFVREYLVAYPERPMVRLHAGQSLKTEWNGKWWPSRVIQVDASLVKVHFEEDNRSEWIYRGSTRLAPLYLELQAAERHRARPMPRTKQPRVNMPYVEYIRSDEQSKSEEPPPPAPPQTVEQRESRQRAVAKKSTATPQPQPPQPSIDNVISRVVYYTPKNAVKPYKMTPHNCGPHCKRTDVLALKDLRTYNPLAKPLLSGWERQIVRFKGHKEVMYRAPCGRRVRSIRELHRYLRAVHADMAVDLFDFGPGTHCLAEFVLNTCRVGKKDLSHGKENVPVPCVNYYDDSLPEFCSYNTERTPTAGVPLNLDPEFLCGCDCTDDCVDKKKCACWQMTLEGARTIGLQGSSIGYAYKRLPEPLPSGIYECNSRCKCKQTCLNRVAQHPLQLKLQVFKTLNRGWGIRALNDVPKGSFLCVYAGNLLTDATANMDGLNEGDEYLAELDYIEVVEQMKEGYEEDIPEADKRLDKKNQVNPDEEESEEESSPSEDDTKSKLEEDDDDFRPGHIGMGVSEFSKRLRKREKKKEKENERAKEKAKEDKAEQKGEEDCITISDDEEVREPSRFTAQAGMQSNEFKSKYRSVRSHFGEDEACYIMDAKVQGNIGRYLNHSCQPNVFVQNVFVDTHDPRFPWVAFFALCHIKAGTELTWNYNYDVGSVPGKVLYCYCGAPNCRGRLL